MHHAAGAGHLRWGWDGTDAEGLRWVRGYGVGLLSDIAGSVHDSWGYG